MSKISLKKILDHPDKEEIICKLVLDISPKDIHEWLEAKYSSVHDNKFIISERAVKIFKDNYLDVYSLIQEDIAKTKKAVATDTTAQLTLSVQDSSAYRSKMLDLATSEIDVRKMVARLCVNVETRVAQIFDTIQANPDDINTKVDHLLIEYVEVLGGALEKYYKFTENPVDTQIIQNNVTVQFMDQHILVFQEAIREVLSEMDLESSMLFMERIQEKLTRLKPPEKDPTLNTDMKFAEAKLLNETINQKLNQ